MKQILFKCLSQYNIKMLINTTDEVPLFLQKGEFYKTLISFDIFVPMEIDDINFKNNLILNNINDLFYLLNTLRFWMIEYSDFPYEIIFNFVIQNHVLNYSELFSSFPELEITNEIRLLLDRNMIMIGTNRCTLSYDATKYGYILLLKYCFQNNLCSDDIILKKVATQFGRVKCLEYIHINSSGNDIIKYTCHLMDYRYDPILSILYTYNLCDIAAKYGNLDCLQFLHENGYSWNYETLNLAEYYNHIHCFEYISKQLNPIKNM